MPDPNRAHRVGKLGAQVRRARLLLRPTAPDDTTGPADGARVAKGLELSIGEGEGRAVRSRKQRVKTTASHA